MTNLTDKAYKTRDCLRWIHEQAIDQVFKKNGITFSNMDDLINALYKEYCTYIKIYNVGTMRPLSLYDFSETLDIFYDGIYYYKVIFKNATTNLDIF